MPSNNVFHYSKIRTGKRSAKKSIKTGKKVESSSFWNPESTVLESGIQYPESGIHRMESRIQDCPGFPYMGRRFTCHVVNSVICSVKEAHTCFDRPGYWMSAICFAKLWKTAFCPRYVSLLKKHLLIVLFTSDVMNKKYKWLTCKRHQICWQNYVK